MCGVVNNAVTGSLANALHASCCQLWLQLSLPHALHKLGATLARTEQQAASSNAVANLQLQLAFHRTTHQDSDHVSTATDNTMVSLADVGCVSTLSPLLPKLTHVVWARPVRLIELMRQVWGGAICSTGSALTCSSLGAPAHIQPRC